MELSITREVLMYIFAFHQWKDAYLFLAFRTCYHSAITVLALDIGNGRIQEQLKFQVILLHSDRNKTQKHNAPTVWRCNWKPESIKTSVPLLGVLGYNSYNIICAIVSCWLLHWGIVSPGLGWKICIWRHGNC